MTTVVTADVLMRNSPNNNAAIMAQVMKVDQVHTRLRKAVAELTLDQLMLIPPSATNMGPLGGLG